MQTLGLSKITPTQLFKVQTNPEFCPYCEYQFKQGENSHLVMESVRRLDHGIISKGVVKCPRCGDAIRTVQHEIEVAASTFKCPTCHLSDTLEYQIENVEPKAGHDLKKGFTFEVKVTCKKCTHKESFKKIIEAILNVIKLKVGPDGVEVSKAD